MSGFNGSHTTTLSVPLTGSLALEAGSFGEEGNAITILLCSAKTSSNSIIGWCSWRIPNLPPFPSRVQDELSHSFDLERGDQNSNRCAPQTFDLTRNGF